MTVTDEPSLGEVVRHLHRIEGQLTDLSVRVVSADLYARDQRELERRFGALEREVQGLRDRLERDVGAVEARVEAQGTQSGTNLRQALYSGLLPAAICVVTLLVSALSARGGG